MSSISPVAHLLLKLHAPTVPAQRGTRNAQPSVSASSAAGLRASAAAHLVSSIRAIRPDDPSRRHRAVRAFLQSSVIGLFGQQALADPKFQDVVDRLQTLLLTQADAAHGIDRVATLLLDSAQEPGNLERLAAGLF